MEKEANFPYLTSFYEDDPKSLRTALSTSRRPTGLVLVRQPPTREVAAFLRTNLSESTLLYRLAPSPRFVEEKATSKAGKTLTPGDASQRASKPRKEVSDMDEDERRAEAARLAAETILGRGR